MRTPAWALETAHVDAHLIVVVKPAGLLSVPGRSENGADCLAMRVREVFGDALVVHRLDMATSGLMLFARGVEAQRRLSIAFAARAVAKRYAAVVHGRVALDAGEIDLPLIADWPNRPRQKVDHVIGKPSTTRYRRVDCDDATDTSRLELEPITGRGHQLRVHLLAIGHPIVGDALYGASPPAGDLRLMLHATALRFAHPATGETIEFLSAAPF